MSMEKHVNTTTKLTKIDICKQKYKKIDFYNNKIHNFQALINIVHVIVNQVYMYEYIDSFHIISYFGKKGNTIIRPYIYPYIHCGCIAT